MQRRQFIAAAAVGAVSAVSPSSAFGLNETAGKRIPLGLDGHSMRSMRWKKWKATQLIEFAAEQRLDAALFNGLHYFESLAASHLKALKDLADRHEMKLYIGAGAIANNGKQFKDTPYTVCNSIRDYTVWPSEDGARFQWMAVGEGMMDVPNYVDTLAGANPGMPIFVESISNSARPIPYLTREYWKAYPNLDASQIIDFLKLVRKGKPARIDKPAEGQDEKTFGQEHERNEFLKSIAYLREHCGAGLKT